MKKIRNILSIALVFVMLIGFAPVNVFAEEAGTPDTTAPTVTKPAADTPAPGTGDSTGTENPTNGGTPAQPGASTDSNTQQPGTGTQTGGQQEPGTAPAGDNTQQPAQTTYTVSFDRNGHGTAPSAQTVNANGTANMPSPAPTADGFRFEGWCKEADCTTPYEFSTPVTENIILYAKWTAVVVEHDIIVRTTGNGTAKATPSRASKDATITVTADPARGYVVDSIVVRDVQGNPLTLSNKKYKNYYNDYPYYPNSRWYRGYDYDDYIRWCSRNGYSRYDYDSFKTWSRRYGYNYDYDDFKRFYDWDDIYDYRWYNRYNYNYSYNYQADFTMPASAVTVEVTFTSAPYYYDGYFYDSRTGTYRRYYDDDYYYYRNRRNKKSNYYERQAEEDKKEEETKVVEEKKNDTIVTKAVISIGSKMIDKVNDDLHTKRLMDAPAYVKDGRVMLPLRFVAEALGLQVSWIKDNRTVVIQDMLFRVEIPVDTKNITVNGVTTTSDVKPEIVNGRVMLPIANIARALGLVDGKDIVWNAATKEVTLTRTITK